MRTKKNIAVFLLIFLGMAGLIASPERLVAEESSVIVRAVNLKVLNPNDESTIAGIGFDNFEGAKILQANLYAPEGYIVGSSRLESGSGMSLWRLVDPNPAQAAPCHIYQTVGASSEYPDGILPNLNFSVVFKGSLSEGTGTGPSISPEFEARVSHMDLDADTDNNSTVVFRAPGSTDLEDNMERDIPDVYPGVVIGVNDDHDESLEDLVSWDRDAERHISAALRTDIDCPCVANHNACVTPVKLRVRMSGLKAGSLNFAVPDNVRLIDPVTLLPVTQPTISTTAGLQLDRTYYLEALYEASGEEITGTFMSNTFRVGVARDIVRVTTVSLDMDVDTNNNGQEDYGSSEDLLESHPYSLGMVLAKDKTPDENPPDPAIEDLPRGLLHKLSDSWTTVEQGSLEPQIKLKKTHGAGDVRIYQWDGATATLLLDTSVSSESADLFDALASDDVQLRFMGITAGDVELALEGTVNGDLSVHVDKVKLSVLDVDLAVCNGGADLDNGESAGPQGQEVLDEDEEDVGAYVLVNWDDDDHDGDWDTTGDCMIAPQPDLDEVPEDPDSHIVVLNEDNLARLTPRLAGGNVFNVGIVELKIEEGVDRIRLWTAPIKGKQIQLTSDAKIWDLNNSQDREEFESAVAYGLWIEAISRSLVERDVTIRLTYSLGSSLLMTDQIKVTCVMMNLGDAVYREGAMPGMTERGHGGLVTKFNGACTQADLMDPTKYTITEVNVLAGGDNVVQESASLDSITSMSGKEYFGCYTNSSADGLPETTEGYTRRLKILKSAKYLTEQTDIESTRFNMFECEAERDNGSAYKTYLYWQGTLEDVKAIRADGLIELTYEMNGVSVWGKKVDVDTYGYDICAYDPTSGYYNVKEHNFYRGGDDPEDGEGDFWGWLAPITQCGYADTYIDSTIIP